MKYVAIVKTAGEAIGEPTDLPFEYPIECIEYEDEQTAIAKHPGRLVMSAEKYSGYQKALSDRVDAERSKPKRSWWKVWA